MKPILMTLWKTEQITPRFLIEAPLSPEDFDKLPCIESCLDPAAPPTTPNAYIISRDTYDRIVKGLESIELLGHGEKHICGHKYAYIAHELLVALEE